MPNDGKVVRVGATHGGEQCDAARDLELTRLRAALSHEQQANREWEWFFANAPALMCVVGPGGRLRKINRAFELAIGYSEEEFIALDVESVVHPDDAQAVFTHIASNLGGVDSIDFEMRMKRKESEDYRWFSWTCPGRAAGSENLHAIVRDVTESKQTQAVLMHQARHDPLTGLANRAAFDSNLDAALARAGRDARLAVALFVIDLDGFKRINDVHGHNAGDEVLRQVAARMTARTRRDDLVCRLGGDEFAVIIQGLAPLPLATLAEKIVDAVRQPIALGDILVNVGCSIGIAQTPGTAEDARGLIQQADSAMYQVKKRGKNGFAEFAPPS